jgi:hypothetical protein
MESDWGYEIGVAQGFGYSRRIQVTSFRLQVSGRKMLPSGATPTWLFKTIQDLCKVGARLKRENLELLHKDFYSNEFKLRERGNANLVIQDNSRFM